ncbi:HsdM family class I SAM-dependent methyltransferase [Candidatus Poriferisocius sp.]|uniref:HsdM family class I SAM-dependent methyltransferase n=1 Tax=Candidatus Poriferisocius sp. TaxID=3101276 RepID=UPI003B027D48
MVSLLLSPEPDLGKSHVVKTIYDPACGTGGMLSVAEEHLLEHNRESRPILYGQDYNDEAWAVCKSDMLLKGQDADNIIRGDSFTSDGFQRHPNGQPWTFDYMLANPPFGVEWKQQRQHIEREHNTLGYDGRFGAGTPRINDGSLLFLQHMLSKMQPVDQDDQADSGGSRIAIVFNGSPLFTGDAGSGESEIRRWIIENDWLEAIVALPDQMFYNTGIATYIWVLTNRKEPHRTGKVQLIDARQMFEKMRKSLGNKRNELSQAQIDDITRIHGNFAHGETRDFTDENPVTHLPRTRPLIVSKVFDNRDFGFQKITVERPLRLRFPPPPPPRLRQPLRRSKGVCQPGQEQEAPWPSARCRGSRGQTAPGVASSIRGCGRRRDGWRAHQRPRRFHQHSPRHGESRWSAADGAGAEGPRGRTWRTRLRRVDL